MAQKITWLGALALGFFPWVGVSGAYLGLGLLVIMCVWESLRARRFKAKTLLLMAAVFWAYAVLHLLTAGWEMPEAFARHWEGARHWMSLWFCLVVGWWVRGDSRRAHWLLGAALLGVVVGVLQDGGWREWWSSLSGQRTGFGLGPIQQGLYMSTALLGLLVMAPRMLGDVYPWYRFAPKLVLWFAAFVLCLQGLIASQSRGAWLAAVLVLPVTVGVRYWQVWSIGSRRSLVLAGLLILLVGGGLIAKGFDTLTERISRESQTWATIVAGDFDKVPFNSVGTRFYLYQLAWQRWLERTVLGWGPGASEALIGNAEISKLHRYAHLHNAYLEALLRFGLVGAALLLFGWIWVCRTCRWGYCQGVVPWDHCLLIAGSLSLLAIWCLFDYGVTNAHWRFYWMIFGGLAVSAAFRHERQFPKMRTEERVN